MMATVTVVLACHSCSSSRRSPILEPDLGARMRRRKEHTCRSAGTDSSNEGERWRRHGGTARSVSASTWLAGVCAWSSASGHRLCQARDSLSSSFLARCLRMHGLSRVGRSHSSKGHRAFGEELRQVVRRNADDTSVGVGAPSHMEATVAVLLSSCLETTDMLALMPLLPQGGRCAWQRLAHVPHTTLTPKSDPTKLQVFSLRQVHARLLLCCLTSSSMVIGRPNASERRYRPSKQARASIAWRALCLSHEARCGGRGSLVFRLLVE